MFLFPNATRPDSALHDAAKRGDWHEMVKLLKRGADIDAVGKDGNTPLICATKKAHLTVVEALLFRGAQVDSVNDYGIPALVFAAANGNVKMVEVVLKGGADVNYTTYYGTALHQAAIKGHEQVAEALLAAGANIHSTGDMGTPLHEAARYRQAAMVEALLASGADVHRTDEFGNTALHDAARLGNQQVALALWRAGADPFQKNEDKETPIMYMLATFGESHSVKLMRDTPRVHRVPFAADEAELRKRITMLASKSPSDEQTVTAQDAIPELQHVLQQHLRQTRNGINVPEEEVDRIVVNHMDPSTGLLGIHAVIKSFHMLRRKYQEPPELRIRFKKATRSKKVLRTTVAKRMLQALFAQSGTEKSSSIPLISFTRSNDQWNDSNVDALLDDNKREENGIDEEAFVKVAMNVLFGE